jgi:hypothetical protein
MFKNKLFTVCGYKNGRTNKNFPPSSVGAVVGSGIRDPGWIKIRIRDKLPGSATQDFLKLNR